MAQQQRCTGCAALKRTSHRRTYLASWQIIAEYEMDVLSTGESIAVLAALFSVMWVAAYVALRRVARIGSA